MKGRADEAVARVMEGLRGVRAPQGMEGRVLRAIEARAALLEGRERWWTVGRVWMMAACGAVVVAGGLSAGVMWPRRQVIERAPNEIGRVVPQGGAAVAAPKAAGMVTRGMPAALSSGRVARRRVKTSDTVGEESLAMWETRAPSLVAPPIPLTEQEVLLRRTAHRGDAEEIAMLKPEVRAARDAEGLKEFEAFFYPAKTGDKEW